MKYVLVCSLILSLLLGLALPALGADGKDQRLQAVTLLVKAALGISNDYTEFDGSSYEYGSQARWSLSWHKEDEDLRVVAGEDGTIYSYNRSFLNDDRSSGGSGFQPRFPALTRAEALALAQPFLDAVLADNETAGFTAQPDSLRQSYRLSYSGPLYLNGLETDAYLSLSLRAADGAVLRFNRSDEGVFLQGETPGPQPVLDEAAALAAFRPTVSPKLHYIATDWEAKEARLVYTFTGGDGLLDALDGTFLPQSGGVAYDMKSLAGGAEPAMTAADNGVFLTEAELAGAAKLAGVLDAEALRSQVLAEPAFGVTEAYSMGPVRYLTDDAQPQPLTGAEDGGEEVPQKVTAVFTLTLAEPDPADWGLDEAAYQALLDQDLRPAVSKRFTLDAKTGLIEAVSTSYQGFGRREQTGEAAEPVISGQALDFLSRRYPDYFPQTALVDSQSGGWSMAVNSFRYDRQVAGYPYEVNRLSVTVNAHTGYVDSFSCAWDEEMTFAPAGTPIGEEAAVSAYLAAYRPALRYALSPLPQAEEDAPLYRRRLAYHLADQAGAVLYVDAESGLAACAEPASEPLTLAYTDVAGTYAEAEINRLAAFGVGYYAAAFQPRKALTELDMLLFLLSADGYQANYEETAADPEQVRQVYERGWSLGILERGEPTPERPITRSELARCFVNMAGYGDAARLQGIFLCGFPDDAQIPAADYGYVAIAKGLGFVQGDAYGAFRPLDAATRCELAVMLYHFMDRA